ASLLGRQPRTQATMEEPPLLTWKPARPEGVMRERFARLRETRSAEHIADTAAFYLPYIEEALAVEPDLRVLGLKRPREEVVASFDRFLDEFNAFPTNPWADEPALGWFHDPLWTATFPQYDTTDRQEGIRRYWRDYNARLGELAEQYPAHVRVFDMHKVLNTEAGQRELLSFAGYASEEQVLAVGHRSQRTQPARPRRKSAHPLDPAQCVVLVPYSGFIHPP